MGYLDETGLATLVGKVKGQVIQLTAAEYADLPATKTTDNKIYFVEDEEFSWKIDDEPTLNSDGLAKSGGIYTYTSKIGTGSLTTTAQTIIPAINELKNGLTQKLDASKFHFINVMSMELTSSGTTGNGTTQYLIYKFSDGTKRQYGFTPTGITCQYFDGSTWTTLWNK